MVNPVKLQMMMNCSGFQGAMLFDILTRTLLLLLLPFLKLPLNEATNQVQSLSVQALSWVLLQCHMATSVTSGQQSCGQCRSVLLLLCGEKRQ